MKFIGFVVNEALEGRASQLKGYTIAVAVYGRSESFDPQIDPIVRVEAGRLRRALAHYYLTTGKNDPVRIEIPKGGYIPTFQTARMPTSEDKEHTSKVRPAAPPSRPSIAVMPLINLTGNKEQEYFAEGLRGQGPRRAVSFDGKCAQGFKNDQGFDPIDRYLIG
jgi:adenylate cyclase